MKFNPTWQQVVLLLGLTGSIVLAHAYVPASAAAVISVASTIIGYSLNPYRGKDQGETP